MTRFVQSALVTELPHLRAYGCYVLAVRQRESEVVHDSAIL